MKQYIIKEDHLDDFGSDATMFNRIVTRDIIEMCAHGWEKPVEEVLDMVEEVEVRYAATMPDDSDSDHVEGIYDTLEKAETAIQTRWAHLTERERRHFTEAPYITARIFDESADDWMCEDEYIVAEYIGKYE